MAPREATGPAPVARQGGPQRGGQSPWRAPQLSMRFWPVFLRNLLVWRKLAIPSLVGNIAEPLMWLVAFGYGLGALVGQVTVRTTAGRRRCSPSWAGYAPADPVTVSGCR